MCTRYRFISVKSVKKFVCFYTCFPRVKNKILRSLDDFHEKHNSGVKAYTDKLIEPEISFH
jgi:hypothetical protein